MARSTSFPLTGAMTQTSRADPILSKVQFPTSLPHATIRSVSYYYKKYNIKSDIVPKYTARGDVGR
jgi:hypothetical protein